MTDCLCNMKIGEKKEIGKLTCEGSIKRRLLDLGFVEGAEVVCIGRSPLGDPKAYLVRGAVIAIRSHDSKMIMVKE